MWNNMSLDQKKRFYRFILMDDIQFYDEFIAELPLEAQERFFAKTPDFLSEYISKNEKINLKDDKIYQNIMGKIRRLKT